MKPKIDEEKEEKTPFDEVLDDLQSCASNPKTATPEKLSGIVEQLREFKPIIDGEGESLQEDEKEPEQEDKDKPSLVIMIGKKMNKKMEEE